MIGRGLFVICAVITVVVAALTCATPQVASLILLPADPDGACADAGYFPCVEPPLCDSVARLTLLGYVTCALHAAPLGFATEDYQQYVARRLQSLGRYHIKGQYALDPVTTLVAHKLRHMHDPLVLHFAGDNGVGKTKLAEVISLSVAQRCRKGVGNEDCRLGDSTLELSGTSYAGVSLREFRAMVVPVLVRHALAHRGNGVVIINELSSLEPEKVEVLMPLLGRGAYFPEYSHVPLSGLIVIVTTDFGQEGRTRGKSLADMRTFINSEFQDLYSRHSTSMIRTFPFLPISLDTASEIVRMTVQDIACSARLGYTGLRRGCRYSRVSISEDAVLWLVEKVKPVLSAENGRAVVQEVEGTVEPLLAAWDQDRSTAQRGATTCRIDMSDQGELEVVAL